MKILDQCQREFHSGNADEDLFRNLENKIEESSDEKEKETLKLELEENKLVTLFRICRL